MTHPVCRCGHISGIDDKHCEYLMAERDRLEAELEKHNEMTERVLGDAEKMIDLYKSQLSVAKECLTEIAKTRTPIGNATITATMAFNCLQTLGETGALSDEAKADIKKFWKGDSK